MKNKFKILIMVLLVVLISLPVYGEAAVKKEIKTEIDKPAKILMVLTSHDQMGETENKTGFYLSEVTHAYFQFIEAGYLVDFASPEGGAAPLDETSRDLKDEENKKFLEDKKLMSEIAATKKLKDIKSEDYKAIYFAGGHGTMWDFPGHGEINRISAEIYEVGGVVAAVCHGPAALVDIKLSNGKYLVEGKDVTAFTNEEEDAVKLSEIMPFALETKLIERGAKFQKAGLWQDKTVVSERLVTGQNPASAASVGKAVIELLSH